MVVQQYSKLLGIDWQLHTLHNPQLSGQVEKIKHLIKLQIVKLGQEAGLSWRQSLPLALLRIRTESRTKGGLSSFKILYRIYGTVWNINSGRQRDIVRLYNKPAETALGSHEAGPRN